MSLQGLGYAYVRGPTGSPSDWVLSPKFAWKGQANYNSVADACTAWVRAQLVPLCGLQKLQVGGATAYSTPDLKAHSGPTLLLVCGSAPGGDCGVWGRALCINDSTLTGSMFETIARAKARGWAVIVADPHRAAAPHKHLLDLYRLVDGASPLLVIAHSYGAALSIGMLKAAEAECGTVEKLAGLALTDGMVWMPGPGWRGGDALFHEGLAALATDAELEEAAADAAALAAMKARRAELRKWVKAAPSAFDPPSDALLKRVGEVGRNWVTSELPLGARVTTAEGKQVVATVSAAATSHPATTHAALDDVFVFLERAAGRRKRGRA